MSNLNAKKGKTEQERVVLAYGEVTGHAHAFYEPDKVKLENDVLKIIEKASLQHEEHTTHTFEPGVGQVIIQREYSMGSLKRVAD